jgi:hypothetical protein
MLFNETEAGSTSSLLHAGDELVNMLDYGQSPNRVINSADEPITHLHYFWCSTTSLFEFRHFLALTSAVRKYRPQLVHFHTALLPQSAPHFLEWYEDVKRTIPLLELHQTTDARCAPDQRLPSADYITRMRSAFQFSRHVMMEEDVVVNSRFRHFVRDDALYIVSSNDQLTQAPIIAAAPSPPVAIVTCQTVNVSTLLGDCQQGGVSPASLCNKNLTHEDVCLHLASPGIVVRHLPQSGGSLAAFLRYNYYGSANPIYPLSHSVDVIPKVGHYVYLGGDVVTDKELGFEMYMSILSAIGIGGVQCVYIHGTVRFTGKLWADLQKRGYCVRWHYWPIPRSVWQQELKGKVEHKADIVRAQLFAQYGGVHLDPDAFFVNPLSEHFWKYEAVIGLDGHTIGPGWEEWKKPAGTFINLGVCMSMPGSQYFSLYQAAQKTYRDEQWIYNSGEKPRQLFERRPWLVHLEPRLQVICGGGVCYPGWAESEDEAKTLKDNWKLWIDSIYVLHVVWPTADEMGNPRSIRNSQTVFGAVARKILAANNIDLAEVEKL